jgi:hypothetical protein
VFIAFFFNKCFECLLLLLVPGTADSREGKGHGDSDCSFPFLLSTHILSACCCVFQKQQAAEKAQKAEADKLKKEAEKAEAKVSVCVHCIFLFSTSVLSACCCCLFQEQQTAEKAKAMAIVNVHCLFCFQHMY